MGDRGYPHRHVVGFERHIAVALAERRFRLEPVGVDQAFDHDLGRCRDVEVDGRCLGDRDRRAGERARDPELVHVDGELLRPGEHHHRRAADHDHDRHRLAALAIFEPVQVAACARRLARNHAHHQPVRRLQGSPIRAHVLDAALGIAGHAQGRGEIGRGVETRGRDRHRQHRDAARRLERIAGQDDLLTGRSSDRDRRDRVGDRLHPGLADGIDRLPHADGVDLGGRRERSHYDRDIVMPPLGVRHIGEKECASLVFGHAAQELPAHQRVQLGVLVDGAIDSHEEAPRLKVGEMVLKIEPRTVLQSALTRGSGLIEHRGRGSNRLASPGPVIDHFQRDDIALSNKRYKSVRARNIALAGDRLDPAGQMHYRDSPAGVLNPS